MRPNEKIVTFPWRIRVRVAFKCHCVLTFVCLHWQTTDARCGVIVSRTDCDCDTWAAYISAGHIGMEASAFFTLFSSVACEWLSFWMCEAQFFLNHSYRTVHMQNSPRKLDKYLSVWMVCVRECLPCGLHETRSPVPCHHFYDQPKFAYQPTMVACRDWCFERLFSNLSHPRPINTSCTWKAAAATTTTN